MKRPELWKVRRELWRVRDQFIRKVLPVTIEPVSQILYNLRAKTAVLRQTTPRTLGPRVAILVLFQPKGLLASTLFTLDHLVEQGWSVLVVSNAPLRATDNDALAKQASVILQRPNVGYDFGAYREGIRYLENAGHKPDRLILMNDSTWFPLRENDTTLARMEALNAAMAGHIFKEEDPAKRARDHVESHLLMFGPDALSHPAFTAFWKNYKMSNSHAGTVERGEKGLTQMAVAAGLSIDALMTKEKLLARFATLPDADLLDVIRHLVLHLEPSRAFCATLLADAEKGHPWRDRFMDWVLDVLSNQLQHLISATFIDAALRIGGLGFVKKAKDPRFQLARRAVLRASDQGRIAPLHPVVHTEIEQAIANWKPAHDWRAKPGQIDKDMH